MTLSNFLIGAFFCYGIFTIQRPGFFADFLRDLWRKFPKALHEPLFECGVCVSSIWGGIYILSITFIPVQFMFPFYLISFAGVCALLDRAVKFFEYGYKYNPKPRAANYSYLEQFKFRDNLFQCFLSDVVNKGVQIVEIGGLSNINGAGGNYISFDKANGGIDVMGKYFSDQYFIIIKGLMFEGDFDYLKSLLSNATGFIVEGSLSGQSKTQLQWIEEAFEGVIRLPYMTGIDAKAPEQCGGDVNNRIVLIKQIK